MLKIYKTKLRSRSMFFFVNGTPQRIEFGGAMARTGNHGQFATSDLDLQRAIESHHDYGDILSHSIYLDSVIGEDGTAIDPINGILETPQNAPVEVPFTPKADNTGDNMDNSDGTGEADKKPSDDPNPAGQLQLVYKDAKELLIAKYGASPDEIKNQLQLVKKIKELNLNIEIVKK